jgi:hypothetical protein
LKAILRTLNVAENMPDQDRAEWTKVAADFEKSDLGRREFAKERSHPASRIDELLAHNWTPLRAEPPT